MINILPKKKLKKPEYTEKPVSAKQYNELIKYYTLEMEKLRKALKKEQEHNKLLIATTIRQENRTKKIEEEKLNLKKQNKDLINSDN